MGAAAHELVYTAHGPDSAVAGDWKRLAARLLERRDEHWQVWVDWYWARLAGHVNFSEAGEIARVSLTKLLLVPSPTNHEGPTRMMRETICWASETSIGSGTFADM